MRELAIPSATGLRTRQPTRLRFYSIFDLDLAAGDTLVHNRLTCLQQKAASITLHTDRTLVLGGCFAELGVMSPDEYRRMIRAVISSCPGPVEYLPHRREAPEKVEAVLAETGASLSGLPGPIEWSVVETGEIPGTVVSFFSTASYTLWRILGDRVRFVTYGLDGWGVDPDWYAENDLSGFLERQSGGHLRVSTVHPGGDRSARG